MVMMVAMMAIPILEPGVRQNATNKKGSLGGLGPVLLLVLVAVLVLHSGTPAASWRLGVIGFRPA